MEKSPLVVKENQFPRGGEGDGSEGDGASQGSDSQGDNGIFTVDLNLLKEESSTKAEEIEVLEAAATHSGAGKCIASWTSGMVIVFALFASLQ